MLITDYLVGRDSDGKVVCLFVNGVLPLDCVPGRADLVKKLTRQDLVVEYVQDQAAVDWLNFPDLPADVVELLESGKSLTICDRDDDLVHQCTVSPRMDSLKVGFM